MIPAVGPVLRCAARALFRFRKSAAAAWRWLGANAKVLAPFGPTRLRSHSKACRRPIRTYDGTRMPAWQPQRTKACHGLPAESGHGRLSAFHHSGRRRTAKMAKSSLFSGKALFGWWWRVGRVGAVLTRVGGVLGRVAGVLSDKMGKAGKGKAAAASGETWYEKKCREDPNFKAERAEAARKAWQAAAADRAAAAPAAAAAAPAATARTRPWSLASHRSLTPHEKRLANHALGSWGWHADVSSRLGIHRHSFALRPSDTS